MGIVWAASSLRDLRAHLAYLAERNPAAARRAQTAIREAVERLAEYPHRGRPGRYEGTRELVIGGLPYVVVYIAGDGEITILRVLHAAQAWPPATP